MRKALASLVAATTFTGLGVVGQTALPGFVSAAHAQASTWSFVGPAPDTTGKPAGGGQDRSPWGDTSGRITSVVAVPDNPATVYIGAAGGGVWKSTDTGATWKSLNDNTDSSVRTGSSEAIGSLWTDKTGKTVYAGTGELNTNPDSQYGTGILKSTDGGASWISYGRGQFTKQRIGGISSARDNTSKVFAATDKGLYTSPNSGLFWSQVTDLTDKIPSLTTFTQTHTSAGIPKQKVDLSNPYRGVGAQVTVAGVVWTQVSSFAGESATAKVYTLTQSGTTWTLRFGDGVNGAIPPKDAQVGIFYSAPGHISGQVFQIEQDPTIANKYWASFGDRCQTESAGVATSDDSGKTWTVVRSSPQAGRVGLGVGSDGETAYASRANCNGSLRDIEKTTTGGGIGTWKATTVKPPNYFHFTSQDENGQGNYDNVTAVDPTDANRVAFGGVTILTTSNGGDSFTDAGQVNANPSGAIHPDFHALAFTGASTFYAGEDGGLYRTTDMGGTGKPTDWTNLNGGATPASRLAITQLYSGAAVSATNLLGGAQDTGSVYPNAGGTPALPAMTDIASSDGFFSAIDTNQGGALYTEYPFLNIQRFTGTNPTFTQTRISPCASSSPSRRCVVGTNDDPVAFSAPFAMASAPSQRLLAGTNKVYETRDARSSPPSWTALSSTSLTKTTNGELSFIAPPQGSATNTVFTTSSDGAVFRTTNAGDPKGTTWSDITGNLPGPAETTDPGFKPFFTSVAYNPTNSAEAWVTVGRLGVGQVYHTSNADKGAETSWTNVTEGSDASEALPSVPALSVVQVGTNIDVGTYYGVWQCTTCAGSTTTPSWQRLGTKLPINVEVNKLTVSQDGKSLVAWTYGRGIWTLSLS